MGRSINSGSVTKSFVLSKVSQESIFSAYFDIPINVINHCVETGELICSPIREDRHPTVGFKYDNRGKLKMKDFSGVWWGDCFDAAALIISQIYNRTVDISNKHDFIFVLKHITKTFSKIFYGNNKDPNLDSSVKQALSQVIKRKPDIEIVVREWNEYDKQYWENFGVNLQFLNVNFVYPVDQYYIDRKINPEPKYYYTNNDPCYAYFLGRDKHGQASMKLYFPKRDKGCTKFITNSNHLEGIYNLNGDNYDYIVLTKSSKDRLSLGCTLLSQSFLYGGSKVKIGVINIPHETYKLRSFEYKWLHDKLKEDGIIISLMDNDRTGMIEAQYLRKEFGMIPIVIPFYLGAKDFAELRSKNNITDITNLINRTIDYVENIKSVWYTKQSNSEPF